VVGAGNRAIAEGGRKREEWKHNFNKKKTTQNGLGRGKFRKVKMVKAVRGGPGREFRSREIPRHLWKGKKEKKTSFIER